MVVRLFKVVALEQHLMMCSKYAIGRIKLIAALDLSVMIRMVMVIEMVMEMEMEMDIQTEKLTLLMKVQKDSMGKV